jgi:Icc-related predicted phosphoesterase
MKILCISDTHRKHSELTIVPCDVLIVCGDVCISGTIEQVQSFADWLMQESDKFRKVILVPGNHDYPFVNHKTKCLLIFEAALSDKFIYLQDSSCIIDDVKFYGSPWHPEHGSGAFSLPRGKKLRSVWKKIPEDVDVLITHCPPFGVGDRVYSNHAGCIELLCRIKQLHSLGLHVFGHVHPGNGTYICDEFPGTKFCNASVCDNDYQAKQQGYLFTHIPDGLNKFTTALAVDLRKKHDTEN